MSELSIDSIREELRRAIFWSAFQATAHKIEGQKDAELGLTQKACGFTEFGVATKLFAPAEGNDWLDAIWGRKTLASVALQYKVESDQEKK
jgi:hypothetical protein